MKRTAITRTKTTRLEKFEAEFEKMKPLVKERSQGYCESWPFVRDHCTVEIQDLYHSAPIAATCQFSNPVNVHHRKYRGRSRGGTNALSNLIHVCEPCHSWIHAHGGFGEPANLLRLALSAGESEEL
jgi:5-methylcytosine-specific restriction endonuclease McrA